MPSLRMRQFPEAEAYRDAGYWTDGTIVDGARSLAEAESDRQIFLGEARPCSAADLVAEAEALVVSLNRLGLRPGDVFSFMLPNWPEAAAINLAGAMGGFIVNPIVPIYRDAETSLILADCKSRLIFVPSVFRRYDYAKMVMRIKAQLPELAQVVAVRGQSPGPLDYEPGPLDYEELIAGGRGERGEMPDVPGDALKMIMYTSGTTGRPKGVLHSHQTLARAVAASTQYWGIQPDDVVLMPSPVTHISGYSNGIERPFLGSTRTILMDTWNACEAVRLADKYGAAMTVAATPFLQELVSAAEDAGSQLASLRCFACGGAAVPSALVRRANRVFAHPAAFRVYGSSEAPFVTLGFKSDDADERAATTDGMVVDYEVRIVDENDAPVPPGADGEILVKGPALFMGYADRQDNETAFTPDGYFRTGDVGHIVDGAMTITDRKKDLIIRGGENLSAKEIEDALHQHPGIIEAAVVGMPHDRLGEGICAFLIAEKGRAPTIEALQAFLADLGLARQKAPERIEIVDELPRTASGKILKHILRTRAKSETAR